MSALSKAAKNHMTHLCGGAEAMSFGYIFSASLKMSKLEQPSRENHSRSNTPDSESSSAGDFDGAGASQGKVNLKIHPGPGWVSTHIFPP